jgi:hypothetical protein
VGALGMCIGAAPLLYALEGSKKVIMIIMRIILVMRRIREGVIEEAKKGLKRMMKQKKRRKVEGKTLETEETKG